MCDVCVDVVGDDGGCCVLHVAFLSYIRIGTVSYTPLRAHETGACTLISGEALSW
jgi:hypothetical protein